MVIIEMQQKAINYLAKQQKNGWWFDFDTLAGKSDEWVTAYIAEILAGSSNKQAHKLAQRAFLRLLYRRPWSAGWGYNKWVPRDADTTIFTIALAEKLGKTAHWRIRKAIRFLEAHVDARTGGVKTYNTAKYIRSFTGLTSQVKFSGWCQPHECVTANALRLKSLSHLHDEFIRFLKPSLRNGYINGYWWVDNSYANSFLAQAQINSDIKHGSAFNKWIETHLKNHKNNTSFNNACLLIIALSRPEYHPPENSIDEILQGWYQRQNSEGAWRGSAQLRIPPPDCINPESITSWSLTNKGGRSIRKDMHGNYTTATIFKALEIIQKYYEDKRPNSY